MNSLKTLLQTWVKIPAAADRIITGLSSDSRTLAAGNIFFALTPDHIHDAVQKGAAAVICEQKISQLYPVPVIMLKNLRKKIGLIAAAYFAYPAQKMQIIGVTGTNGKTSCTHFIAQALKMAGKQTAVIGTVGNGVIGQITESTHTTPDAIALQTLLAKFQQQHVDVVALETSSHGLAQYRTQGIEFFLGIFTNLTRDHLDYHGSLAKYAKAKFRLFEQTGIRYGILNADDNYGKKWLNRLSDHLAVYATSINPVLTLPTHIPLIQATHIDTQKDSLRATVKTPWGEGVFHTPLLGKFNISNLLAVIGTLGIMGLPLPAILHHIAQLKNVPGRLQLLGGKDGQPLVIIDYAHTPDALEKTLCTIREHCQGDLWCIFGCGGDRDRGKRPEMGRIAEHYADQIIITDDNPRHENPLQIIADIRAGIASTSSVIIEHDRRRAITHAIQCAKPGDAVLIAGKGHENYQIIGAHKFPFSDIVEAKMALIHRMN